MFAFILNSFNFKKNKNQTNIWILIFYFFINLKFLKCDYDSCKTNKDFGNNNCFNNIIKFEGNKYRAGRFETTKDGGLIIEYSEDALPGGGRLFYRLTKEGRGYYDNDNPIRTFNITKVIETRNEKNEKTHYISSRYEARNALVIIDGDTTGKEYLFSTSCWFSLTELHDLETGNYSAWFTSTFLKISDKYIFSYNYDILRQPNTNYYFIIYTQYEGLDEDGHAYSKAYYIRKFKIKFFGDSNPYEELAEAHNDDNENDRIVSAFILENKNLLLRNFII